MTDKSNTEMLLPQAGIPGYIPQPKKNASEDVIGEYKKQVQQLGDKGLKEDKTGLSAKLTYIVALAWAFSRCPPLPGCCWTLYMSRPSTWLLRLH